MTGWNMPPGCNVSDIPGNRPEDQKQEAFYDKMLEEFPWLNAEESPANASELVLDENDAERFMKWMWMKISEAYSDGYAQGMADEAAAQEEKRALDIGP